MQNYAPEFTVDRVAHNFLGVRSDKQPRIMQILTTFLLLSSGLACASVQPHYDGSLRGRHGVARQLMNALPWIGPNLDVGVAGLNTTLPLIDTTGAGNVSIWVDISVENRLEAEPGARQDVLKIYYKVDSQPEVLWKDIVGENVAEESVSFPAGSQLSLRVDGKTSYSSEIYLLRNFQVTAGEPRVTTPVASPAAGTPVATPVAAPTLNPPQVPTASCQTPASGQDVDIGVGGPDKIQTFDTSCLDTVKVSLQLSHTGRLESTGTSTDQMSVYYKIDNGPEVLWISALGEAYDRAPVSPELSAGDLLTLRFTGSTTTSNEAYIMRNIEISEPGSPPPTMAPIPLPPVAPSPQVCGVPKVCATMLMQ